MSNKAFIASFICLGMLICAAVPAYAQQKAGQVTKHTGQAFIDGPTPSRPGLKAVSTSVTVDGAAFKWEDTLRTGDASRMRAQLNDGSILSIGQNARLKVVKHDERSQQ